MEKREEDTLGFTKGISFEFSRDIQYSSRGIVSKNVLKTEKGNISLFAFDKGESLSEHTAPFDALVQVLEGLASIQIGGKEHLLSSGESIIMPANITHAISAPERFKMILTMLKA
ncbi:MAG: cupin domain-containing protein [Bacteroidota bacterium]|nr:cupin domain-containing protein [Bacteroidota bacterium]